MQENNITNTPVPIARQKAAENLLRVDDVWDKLTRKEEIEDIVMEKELAEEQMNLYKMFLEYKSAMKSRRSKYLAKVGPYKTCSNGSHISFNTWLYTKR